VATAANYLEQSPEVIKKGLPFFVSAGSNRRERLVQVADVQGQGMLKGELDRQGLIDKRYAIAVQQQ